jgi:hypothetical protein
VRFAALMIVTDTARRHYVNRPPAGVFADGTSAE